MTTMILEPPSKTRLGVGLDSNRRPAAEQQAWKKHIGTKQIPARLAMLPEGESRMKRLGVSAAVQLVFVVFILLSPLLFPHQMETALSFQKYEIPMPISMIPVAPPPPPPPPPKIARIKTVEPKIEPVVAPVLSAKQPHIFVVPKAIQPKVEKVEAKAPVIENTFVAAKIDTPQPNQPKKPKEDVKVGMMSSGNATPATVKAPAEKVQTGGFGTTDGLTGKTNPNAHLIVNGQGLPTLPGGPGYGNGTGGDKGIRGTVASTGFGNGTANPPPSAKRGALQSTGFADASVAAEAPKTKAANDGPADSADILEKPHPQYTAEGRSLKIEGDVVIEMVFLANGSVQVNRVVSGLGHGLDEAATRAAQQIKFKPARREGQPVDFPARVRIEFRLAY